VIGIVHIGDTLVEVSSVKANAYGIVLIPSSYSEFDLVSVGVSIVLVTFNNARQLTWLLYCLHFICVPMRVLILSLCLDISIQSILEPLQHFNQLLSFLLYLFWVAEFVIWCYPILNRDLHLFRYFFRSCSPCLLSFLFILFLLFICLYSFELPDIHPLCDILNFELRILWLDLCGEDLEEILELLSINELKEAYISSSFLADPFNG
jgi:hypothetical protein